MKLQSLKHIIAVMTLPLMATSAMSAADNNAAFAPDSVAARLDRQRFEYPQETIHVTTDQGVYLAGDTIWMRPFVVDAATHQQVGASRYVYVELAAPTGEVVKRVKLLGHDGRYKGYLPLALELPEGQYTLSAYTTFMRNQGPEFFFRKPVRILSPYALREGFEIKSLVDNTMTVDRKSTVNPMKIKAGDDERIIKKGEQTIDFSLSKNERKAGTILVSNGNYSRYVTLAPSDTTLAVTFHPEGGYLIPGAECKVGVKAIGTDGLGRDIRGTLLDSRGNTVASLETIHAGMGTVSFTPQAGETYSMQIGGQDYPLPAPDARAAVIHVSGADTPGADISVSAVGNVPAGAMLVAQSRGQLRNLAAISPATPVKIARDTLGEGVNQLLLIDASGNTLSERLVWNAPAAN